ncbi:hypothetical protein [Streptomyces scabiei]|uniref:hypothetical protein n=1 Tax=Streptomyces scabiei TaxID=1930 RepID=UPI000765B924|nr:hypothetical protein [Streptomyces scabiei]MBP5930439.1 hypothetical protein [Streptomyces sp. LBUM 1479]
MNFLPHRLRRSLKRRRFAREWRACEVFTFQCAPVPTWSRVRRMNDLSGVWLRRPERRAPRETSV